MRNSEVICNVDYVVTVTHKLKQYLERQILIVILYSLFKLSILKKIFTQ